MPFRANDQSIARLNGMGGRFRVAVEQAAERSGQALVAASKNGQRNGPKSGRVYGSHKASAPGEYSAVLSKKLVKSTDYQASPDQIRFGVGVQHGRYQELGTSKMAPRPNLGNAVDETLPEINRIFGKNMLRRIVGPS